MSLSYEVLKSLVAQETLPAMVVDLEAFKKNVIRALEYAPKHLRIRLATKSIRVPYLIKLAQILGGDRMQGLMCYSAREALELSKLGFDDLLVAYPSIQKADLMALREVHEGGKKIVMMIDCIEHVEKLELAMKGVREPFRVLMEVDMSWRPFGLYFGVRRSPVRTVNDARKLAARVKAFSNVRCVGYMGYEGQVAGLQDRNPFARAQNWIKTWIRKCSFNDVLKKRSQLSEALKGEGVTLEIANGGGTGNLNWLSRDGAITEVTLGSGLLNSHLFDYFSNVHFEAASFFALQAVRSSDRGMLTCQGGGYIASGQPGWDRLPIPYLPAGSKLVSMEGAGEVQTPVVVRSPVAIGDPIFFRSAKSGEIMERFQTAICIKDGRISERAPTYRGLGWNFF